MSDKAIKLTQAKTLYDNLRSMVAVNFDEDEANAAGSYVCYQGSVYLLTDGHTAGTTWANTTKVGPTNIGGEVSTLKSALQGKASIIKNTSSGNPVVFYDGVDGLKLDEIEIKINLSQEGTGEPTKDNVRNISELYGLTIKNSGQDSSNPTEIDVSWEERGAVVSGRLNTITGELFKDYDVISAKWGDIKTENVNQSTGLTLGKMTFSGEVMAAHSQSEYGDLTICNVCGQIRWANHTTAPAHYYVGGDKIVWCSFPSTMSDDQIVQIVGKLTTPVKVATLTPVEIQTVAGINKIWSDDDVTFNVEYSADTNVFIRQRIDGYVTPEIYGAAGDGITDDTNAIIKALESGKKVVLDKNYYIEDLELPGNVEIEINGIINLNGTVTIKNPNVNIHGNGTVNAADDIAFLLYPKAGTTLSDVRIKGLKIIGDNTNTCFAFTNIESNGGMCFTWIDCDILYFLYGVHSYQTVENNTWFSAISVEGTIRECLMAIHFDWTGYGSYIKSMIQPILTQSKTDDRPLVKVQSNNIVACMMWDYGSARNKKMLEIAGKFNKILTPIPVYEMICASGLNYTLLGDVSPLEKSFFRNIPTTTQSVEERDVLPIEMPYDNTNDIAYMAGTNKTIINATDSTLKNIISQLLSNKVNLLQITGEVYPEAVISFDFPEDMPLREVAVIGEILPKTVKIEYKDTNGNYHDLVTRERDIDYTEVSGRDSHAFWQFDYDEASGMTFDANFASGVRITMTEDTDKFYKLSRIYIGVAKTIMANKYGDDLVATSLKLKDGNTYYYLSVQNGQVIATPET